jgi:L-fuconolactonase
MPVLDAHIHLFDPTRQGGVPWPSADDPIYKPALSGRYESLAAPLNVVGAIAIEASPLLTDNDWLLQCVRSSTLMVGMVGNLEPTAPGFGAALERLQQDPLFLGIRHGNLWNGNLAGDLANPALWPALRQLEQAGLVFETANPDISLLKAVLQIAQRQSGLTIVIDHLPHMEQPSTSQGSHDLSQCLAYLAKAPHVAIKLSEIPKLKNGTLVLDPAFYRDRLDALWDLFGPDRVIFGSDWPNSDHVASLEATFSLTKTYMSHKSTSDREKFFFTNSQKVYKWKPRRQTQSLDA